VTQPQPGTQLIADRYAVRSLIGRGGSGAVWRGEDLHLRRPVAIKQIVLSESRSTRSRTRAMREAQAVAKLDTPGVVGQLLTSVSIDRRNTLSKLLVIFNMPDRT
jgi:serine/threonine protein kinase